MRLTRRVFCLLAAICTTVSSSPLLAQGIPRYRPSRPTVSPYINLLRRDSGPLPNYYTYVRPLQDQAAINQQQATLIRQNQMSLNNVQGQVLRMQESTVRSTGTGGGFMNYSHYYPGFGDKSNAVRQR